MLIVGSNPTPTTILIATGEIAPFNFSAMPIKIGIIGTGGMARQHAARYSAIRGVRKVACADVDYAKAKAFAREHNFKTAYGSAEEMLADAELDAVSIVTPDRFHCENTLAALRAGIHVLCEKPIATSLADAKRMLAAAKRAGVIHMVNFSYRQSAATRKIATEIAAGKIGRVTNVIASYRQGWLALDWRNSPQLLWRLDTSTGSSGALGDIGVHILDLVDYMAGPIKKINCQLSTYSKLKGKRHGKYTLDANDSMTAQLEFSHGTQGMLMATRYATSEGNSIDVTIYGEEGAFKLELRGKDTYSTYLAAIGPDARKGIWKTFKAPPVKNNFERFCTAIRTDEQQDPSFIDGVRAQLLLDRCTSSAKIGKWVTT